MAPVFPIMNFPNGLEKALTLSYDDGVDQDIRLIEIMNAHGLKGTFNINSGRFAEEGKVYAPGTIHRPMSESACVELYTNSGHEVAIHGLHHPHLENMSQPTMVNEIISDRMALEASFGGVIRGMAYPYGTYNDRVVEVLRVCGVAYSRTTQSTKKFSIPTDWLRMPATCKHTDAELQSLTDKFVGEKKAFTEPWLFYLWGHSYEFERDDNWDVIERFAEQVGGRDDIWYATNIEIHDYVEAYRALLWSANAKRVYNPTDKTVWFSIDKTKYCVKSGETIEI